MKISAVLMVILTLLTPFCFGIKCHNCDRTGGKPDPSCAKMTTEECKSGWCLEKFITDPHGLLIVSRRCVSPNELPSKVEVKCKVEEEPNGKGDVCYCNTDECNGNHRDGSGGNSGCGKTKSISSASWAFVIVTDLLSIYNMVHSLLR